METEATTVNHAIEVNSQVSAEPWNASRVRLVFLRTSAARIAAIHVPGERIVRTIKRHIAGTVSQDNTKMKEPKMVAKVALMATNQFPAHSCAHHVPKDSTDNLHQRYRNAGNVRKVLKRSQMEPNATTARRTAKGVSQACHYC